MDDEFPPGRCVDCGMSVPFQDIICDICKDAWQQFSYSGHLGRRGHDALQQGPEELQGQGGLQLVPPEEAPDAPLRSSEEG